MKKTREPMQLPDDGDWPSPLVRGDWYVAIDGQEIILADCWVRKSDGVKLRLTPPPLFK